MKASYVLLLRKVNSTEKVPTNSTLYMKLATLCYIKNNGKTLMLHRVKWAKSPSSSGRKENDMHQDKWNGLGGKLIPGETPEECVIREVKEESGLTIKNPSLKGIITFPATSSDEEWYVFVFVAKDYEGDLIDSDEGNLEWVDDNNIQNLNLWEGDKLFLKWLEEDGIFSGKIVYKDNKLVDHKVVFYS